MNSFTDHASAVYVAQLVQSLSHVQLFVTPLTAACQACQSITNSQSFLKFMKCSIDGTKM